MWRLTITQISKRTFTKDDKEVVYDLDQELVFESNNISQLTYLVDVAMNINPANTVFKIEKVVES